MYRVTTSRSTYYLVVGIGIPNSKLLGLGPTVKSNTTQKMYLDKFIPGFSQLKSELLALGITVLNASPYSRLNVFPKITIDQALGFS